MQQKFQVVSPYEPQGDQPEAIAALTKMVQADHKHNLLLGVTGSGKTFTMAHVIANVQKPTLVMAPNKTLAAQLFTELREFFPHNAVGFFISYYDYYQPEAYLPGSDTYIAKDSAINDDIDKMRHAATQALFERRDVIIVASVSCIYGLGDPKTYAEQVVAVKTQQKIARNDFLRQLLNIQYTRNDVQLGRGNFRVRGDVVDILPANQKDTGLRVEFFGDEIERISLIDILTGKTQQIVQALSIYPNSHYVTEESDIKVIVRQILTDLGVRLKELKALGKMVEYQRLEQRTMNDVEMLEELGFCPGIENYSRYLTGKKPGEAPPTLLDYFPKDFLTIVDESHITMPQVRGMFRGDRARKTVLVDYGFRLPSALDNRPLNFDEFLERSGTNIYVSATPGVFEMQAAQNNYAEQIIRPTGLIDPEIEVRPAKIQVDDLYTALRETVAAGGRALVTTLTKRMSEELTQYYKDMGLKVCYLHADIDSLERFELLRNLRRGDYDILIGINLLREGLDLPEVSLVAVLDADKEGFLRSRASLIQIVGRAARNQNGRVIFYGDSITENMQQAIDETNRRRKIQIEYNRSRGIEPRSIVKKMNIGLREIYGLSGDTNVTPEAFDPMQVMKKFGLHNSTQLDKLIRKKTNEMQKAARELQFEQAANLRDELKQLKDVALVLGGEDGPET